MADLDVRRLPGDVPGRITLEIEGKPVPAAGTLSFGMLISRLFNWTSMIRLY